MMVKRSFGGVFKNTLGNDVTKIPFLGIYLMLIAF